MHKRKIPDLTFPGAKFTERQIPWDLQYMLYPNAAALSTRDFSRIDKGFLGPIAWERLPMVVKLHEVLHDELAKGTSQYTVGDRIYCLRIFYRWADAVGRSPTLTSARGDFLDWTEYLLLQRSAGTLGHRAFYKYAVVVGSVLDELSDAPVSLLTQSRIRSRDSARRKRVLGTEADKQNISETFSFGHMLLDLTDALTAEAIQGELPVRIQFRTGQLLEEWCGFRPMDSARFLSLAPSDQRRRTVRRKLDPDDPLKSRHALANLRIEAELLIFMACTGMNLAQARALKVGRFVYASHLDGYQVRRIYKDRRKGEVEFEIYREYRHLIERYLVWRQAMFPNDERLFPRWQTGRTDEPSLIVFSAVKSRCKRLGIRYCGTQVLRRTRTNWLLRRTQDPDVTAEMAQHAKETLLRIYENPNHQLAVIEISHFHLKSDPTIAPPGPGTCTGKNPEPLPNVPPAAPRPDCTSPAGCLFCQRQRDLDDADYPWSLASFRYLKSLELSKYRPPVKRQDPHPAALVISRIGAKLDALRSSDPQHAQWVDEALTRIDEGVFHPAWDGFIQLIELRK
ncbi:site-specific integrase [Paraburkholderia sp. MM5482-R1]|uniref:site-specific integrase n=1 Tax=unclassified Paraburkholderia TaxID=2615204 RepID=UPI003D226098